METDVKKILLINLTRMGDILQSTPLLQALKARYPAASIYYLAVTGFAEVCRCIPEIDRVVPFDFNSAVAVSKEAVRFLPRRLGELQAFVDSLRHEKFDLVINLSHSRISALISLLIGVERTRGLALNAEGYRLIRHPWARYFFTANLNRHYNRFNNVDIHQGLALDESESGEVSVSDFHPFGRYGLSFRWTPEAERSAARLLSGWRGENAPVKIGFQPGASLACKRWPEDSFRRLGDLLHNTMGAGIVVFGSDKEVDLARAVCAPLGNAALNVAGRTDVPTLGALLGRMDLLITNDTGTQHVAAAVGTPVLSLCFGGALSHETGPFGRNHVVVESSLPCYPCSFHVDCKHFRCQESVTPEVVLHVAKKVLDKGNCDGISLENDPILDGVNVWRTDFDSDGLWILRPVIRRPITTSEFVALCARELWKSALCAPRKRQNSWGGSLDDHLGSLIRDYRPFSSGNSPREIDEACRALRRLEKLALTGKRCCENLEEAALRATRDLDAIKRAGEEIEKVDREITLTGFRLPEVNHLVLDFNFGKQNLGGKEIGDLARQTAVLYRRLYRLALDFRRMLESWPGLLEEKGGARAEKERAGYLAAAVSSAGSRQIAEREEGTAISLG